VVKIFFEVAALLAVLISLVSISACLTSPASGSITDVGAVTSYRSGERQTLAKDVAAPNFQFTMPDGNTMLLSDLKDTVVLLNFWRIDCPYCVEEMPLLEKAHLEWQDKGVIVLGVNVGDSSQRAGQFLSNNNITFPTVIDGAGYASTLYGISYIPVTVIIDKAGTIVGAQPGAFQTYDEINTAIVTALARPTN